MLSKELEDEIRSKSRDINKLNSVNERVDSTVEYRYSVQARINDELDELFSNINLKRKKDEEI